MSRKNTIANFERSNALYERALKTIPLASQTFSKSSNIFVKGAAPLFLDRGEGACVWDVDGNRYIDFVLGLMPVILGYRDQDVDNAIAAQLQRGISFSLATELEVELAELLVDIIPCAEMVRFGKNGSDATSAAIRLARAYTGRDRIAVCGYHGWHDWYIGTTTRDRGVPRAVKELSAAFPFNDATVLADLLKSAPDQYAAVILEPAGAAEPAPGFLQAVQQITQRHGAILVFDEIVTGFRVAMGGAQEKYGVTPDLACFGKSLGNGMPISAIVGRRDIMRLMEDIFYSGTFGGEALSLAAALATVKKLKKENAVFRMRNVGHKLAAAALKVIKTHQLETNFAVRGDDWRPYIIALEGGESGITATSLLRQETIAHGLLLPSGFNLCLRHDDPTILGEALSALEGVGEALSVAYRSPNPRAWLRGEPVRPTFQVRKT